MKKTSLKINKLSLIIIILIMTLLLSIVFIIYENTASNTANAATWTNWKEIDFTSYNEYDDHVRYGGEPKSTSKKMTSAVNLWYTTTGEVAEFDGYTTYSGDVMFAFMVVPTPYMQDSILYKDYISSDSEQELDKEHLGTFSNLQLSNPIGKGLILLHAPSSNIQQLNYNVFAKDADIDLPATLFQKEGIYKLSLYFETYYDWLNKRTYRNFRFDYSFRVLRTRDINNKLNTIWIEHRLNNEYSSTRTVLKFNTGSSYITEYTYAQGKTYYSYINDKLITEERTTGINVEYIVDGELKYSGLMYGGEQYFYGYDVFGRINSILDVNGKAVVEYFFTATGELYVIGGSMHDTLGTANSIFYDGKGIYNHEEKIYYVADGVYDPSSARKINCKDGAVNAENYVLSESEMYFIKAPINPYTVIHDKLMQIVAAHFIAEDIEAVYGVITTDRDKHITGIADVYVLPYTFAAFSLANFLYGGQVYSVVLNAPGRISTAGQNMWELTNSNGARYISNSKDKPTVGTMY
jgi:hypothetical protein